MAPELLSYIDRKAMLTGCLVSNLARLSVLSTRYLRILAECERHTAQMKVMYDRFVAQQRAEYDRLVVRQRLIGYSHQVAAALDAELLSYESEYERNVTALKARHERNTAALKAEHVCQSYLLTVENVELSRRLKLIDSEEKP